MRKSVILPLSIFLILAKTTMAATFSWGNSPSVKTKVGNRVTIPVTIDTERASVTGADAVVEYDSSALELVTAESGGFFPFFTHQREGKTVRLSGVILDPKEVKNGTGTLAVLTFKAAKSGQASLHIICDTTLNSTSKIVRSDLDATNVLHCDRAQNAVVAVQSSSLLDAVTSFIIGIWK